MLNIDIDVKEYKCVGCGYCCLAGVCGYGTLGNGKQCVFLTWNDDLGMYRCMCKAAVAEMAGTGCCTGAQFNTWRTDVRERHKDKRGDWK